jgi:hypothetical protein
MRRLLWDGMTAARACEARAAALTRKNIPGKRKEGERGKAFCGMDGEVFQAASLKKSAVP